MTDPALTSLLSYCAENGRVCPKPIPWHEFWESLPNKRRLSITWEPRLPLVLGAWHVTSDADKVQCLVEHIEWAHANAALESSARYLRALPENSWHHAGEAL